MKSSQVLSPPQEADILKELNEDVKNSIRDNLNEFGKIFGARIYDEFELSKREDLIKKIKIGLFGSDEIMKERTNEAKQEKKEAEATEILELILKKRKMGLDKIYLNYVMVFFVKPTLKSAVSDVKTLNMFRFSKRNQYDNPVDNFFIGTDKRLYNNWADFVENHKLPHNSLVFAPAGGHFLFRSGELQVDLYHVTRYLRTYVEPVLAGVGLLGTGALCVSLPPVGMALGLGAAGVGAVSGARRGIVDLKDRWEHKTLLSLSSLLPTLDLLSNLLFVHSAVGALRASSTILASEKFATSILLTEKALRIGAMSRLSLDIMHTVIAVGLGELSFVNAASRLVSSFLFLFNTGFGFDLTQENIQQVLYLPATLLTYENVQPFLRLARDFFNLPCFHLIQNANDFTGLLSLVLHNLRSSERFSTSNLTNTLLRVMNMNWHLMLEDLQRCKKWASELFPRDQREAVALSPNIQMAIVYHLHRRLSSHFPAEMRTSTSVVDFIETDLMPEVVDLWKEMCAIVYPDTSLAVKHSKVMRYLLDKIDKILSSGDENSAVPALQSGSNMSQALQSGSNMSQALQSGSNMSPIKKRTEIYTKLKSGLFRADKASLCAECIEMISREELQEIRYVMQHKYTNVSFIEKESDDASLETVYYDGQPGQPFALSKIDSESRVGILVKCLT